MADGSRLRAHGKAPDSPILPILVDAVLAGAAEIVRVRAAGAIGATYKDATELVTLADTRSDAAIKSVFEARLPVIDPRIAFHLEESGVTGEPGAKHVGADPLDGTSHFVAGGNLYSVQAHYAEDGVPLVGVVFQPEVFLPMQEAHRCVGRLVTAVRGEGAFVRRTEWRGEAFHLGRQRRVQVRPDAGTRALVGCVPVTGKMTPEERAVALRVQGSGIIGSSTGTGNAGGNVLMIVFGGQDVYANFGAGTDLDLMPPQVIALEAGLVVWDMDRRAPVWHVSKQPVIVARTEAAAERVLHAARH
jgi:3'-phosphoadenosine 5'-phosphosulfate (PAPS) 3'-phosphatase